MQQFILQENVLTDNVLTIADKGKMFKGGYIGYIQEFTFLNEWNDKEKVVKFKKVEPLRKYLNKRYPEFQYTYELTETILN
jgi:hypothetical protein